MKHKGDMAGAVDPDGIRGGGRPIFPGAMPLLRRISYFEQPGTSTGGGGDNNPRQGVCVGLPYPHAPDHVAHVDADACSDPEDEREIHLPAKDETEGREPVAFDVAVDMWDPSRDPDLGQISNESMEQRDRVNWSSCQAKLVVFALVWNAFNLFRFPDAVYRNGGGSLVLAYLVIMIFVMQPLVFFELLLGQLYLRKNSHRGIHEVNLFSFVASGIGAGTFLTGLFFLPNQLISMNYASLYFFEVFRHDQPSCACKYELIGERMKDWNGSCIPLKEIFDSVGIGMSNLVNSLNLNSSILQRGFLSCESHYRANILINPDIEKDHFLDTLNVRLLFPALIGTVIVLLLSSRKLPNMAAKVIAWISPLVPLTVFTVLGYQLTWHGWQQGIFDLMDIDAELNIFADLDCKVWAEAIKLAFITTGVGFGVLPIVASSNPRRFPQLYRTSWMYIVTVCLVCLASTLNAFTELGILSDIMGRKDLRNIVQETTHLSLITFCSFICKNSQVFRCLANCFFGLIFITSCWAKSVVCQGIISPTERVGTSRRLILPCIMFFVEAMYIFPESRLLLENTNFFGGAWTSCSITMLRVVAFVTVFGVGKLKSHVREVIHQNLPGFFVVQLKFLLTPFIIAMFVILCPTILGTFPIYSSNVVAGFPEWLKIYGMILNILPLLVLFFYCSCEVKSATRRGSTGPDSFLEEHPMNISLSTRRPTSIMKSRALSITNLSTNSTEHDVITRPKPAFTSFSASEADERTTAISLDGLDLDGYIDRVTKPPMTSHYAESAIVTNPDHNVQPSTSLARTPIGDSEVKLTNEKIQERFLEFRRSRLREIELRDAQAGRGHQDPRPNYEQSRLLTAAFLRENQSQDGHGDGQPQPRALDHYTEIEAEDLDKTYVIAESEWVSPPPATVTPPTPLLTFRSKTPPTPPPRPRNHPRSKMSCKSTTSNKSEEVRNALYTLDEILEKSGDAEDLCPDYEEVTGKGPGGSGSRSNH